MPEMLQSTSTSAVSVSADIEEQPIMFFEGPEKTLEVEFQGAENGVSLRQAGRAAWDRVVKAAAASILDTMSNEYYDSYILSESSLFVMDDKIIIKTCGTTTLLHALPVAEEVGRDCNMDLGFTVFMRKDLQAPGKQCKPHRNFNEEIEYFADFFHTKGDIVGQVMGPITTDHWNLCTSPALPNSLFSQPHFQPSCTINVMMYGLNPMATRKFCKSAEIPTGPEMTVKAGITDLLPKGTMIHEFAFEPCGYSMNALFEKYYATIHVTPESSCSYASFETNIPEWTESHIGNVLDVFLPSKFTITRVGSHEACGCGHASFPAVLTDSNGRSFHRTVLQQTSVASRDFVMANYRCESNWRVSSN